MGKIVNQKEVDTILKKKIASGTVSGLNGTSSEALVNKNQNYK
jgi:hypothetical protein